MALKSHNDMEQKVITLMVDEMSIRQLVEYQNGEYHGYVDLGSEVKSDGDARPLAKQALMFMAVCLNAHWKVPLGYFLIDTLNGRQRADLLITCLDLVHETGVKKNLCQKIFHQLMLNCLDFFNDQEMTNHIKQQDLIDNHKYQLIKLVAYNYINLRLRHEARKINQSSQTNVRQKYNRLVLFAHQ
ncbi:hypothetical protein ABEB36_000071 [Hypothenemus hampei]|uniref:Transposable element P transposase-like RNase H domain-containing protein n=1 Tax=Hypothenemus hampei TaxID=57062 RepID=A0ABD1FAN3_HYPHA